MISNLARGVDAFTSNAFLVAGTYPTLVDTGANFDAVAALEERGIEPERVVLTHTHPDHVGNLEALREAFDPQVLAYDPDAGDRELEDGETVEIGDGDYEILHTPGHKDDHVCLYAEGPGIVFAGDLVFERGFGRTDLPEGDRATLVESINHLADRVGPDLRELHPGHGPSVTDDPRGTIELAGRMASQ